jgi:hypothetical protein
MIPICFDCAWLFEPGEHYDTGQEDVEFTCMAYFPAPIPEDIWLGRDGHHEVRPDQESELVYTPLRKYVAPRK